jgi:hypothetical protein
MKLLVVSSHAQANEWLTRHVEIAWPQCEYRVLRAERLFEPQPVQSGGADVVVVILWQPLPNIPEPRELQALTRLAKADNARPVVVLTGPRSKRFAEVIWQTGIAAHLELGSVTREAVLAALRAAARQLEIQSASMTRPPVPAARGVPFRQQLSPVEVLAAKPQRQTTLMKDPLGTDVLVFKYVTWERDPQDADPVHARMRDWSARLAGVSHPALELIRGLWREDGGVVVATEYLGGGSLGARRVAGIGIDEALRWFVMLADGLAVLHRAGLAHGDVRASNVVFRDRHQPVWIDFAALTPAGCHQDTKLPGTAQKRDLVRLGWLLRDLLVSGDRALSEDPPGFVAPLPAPMGWLEPVFRGLVRAPGAEPFDDAAHAIGVLESLGARHNRDLHFAQLARLQWPAPASAVAGR